MDTTVRLGPLKFSLQATIDHHGPSIDSGHYTASINCCKKTFYCNDHKITEFGITDKNSSTAYIVLYKWINTWFFGLEQEGGSLIAPMALAHPLHPIDNRSRNKRRNLWVGRCVSSWWPWFPSRSSVLIYMYIYIYMYVHSLYEFCYRSYIQREYHSVLAKLYPITFYRIISGECAVPGLNATFCFLWFTNCVLLFDKNLILGCLWPLVFVLNILILGIWCSTIPHLPGCFCPWLFFENIGFNTVLTDPFMSHLAQLGYSAGEFQALQLIVLAAFGVVD